MEFVCRQCEGTAFRILPATGGTVSAECVVCGTLTMIEIPKLSAHASPPTEARRQRTNGHRHDGSRPGIAVLVERY